MKANIPPFYVGQKVVYVTGLILPKNSIHVIRGMVRYCCGCWIVDIGLKVSEPFYVHCHLHGLLTKTPRNGIMYAASTSFRPIQEQKFPLLTFTQIKEKEREEVLSDN